MHVCHECSQYICIKCLHCPCQELSYSVELPLGSPFLLPWSLSACISLHICSLTAEGTGWESVGLVLPMQTNLQRERDSQSSVTSAIFTHSLCVMSFLLKAGPTHFLSLQASVLNKLPVYFLSHTVTVQYSSPHFSGTNVQD